MTTGSLLWRGMIVGFVAALLSFGLLKVVGEPAVDRAIAFESAMDEAKAKAEHDAAVAKGETPPPPRRGAGAGQPPGAGRHRPLHRRHHLQHRFRRPVRACFRDLLRPHGELEPSRDLGAARAQRLPRRLRRPDPQVSGEPALDRQSRHDRPAHRDLLRDDPAVARPP